MTAVNYNVTITRLKIYIVTILFRVNYNVTIIKLYIQLIVNL